MLILTGCSSHNLADLKNGVINIYPLCSVETIPPNPNCLPTQETYNAWPIAILTTDKKKLD